jgi:NAD(P)H-hydrate epimerase
MEMACRLRPLSRQEVRALDVQAAREFELPTLILMENAGRGAAALLAARTGAITPETVSRPPLDSVGMEPSRPSVSLPRVLILCGPGNNGGDGGVVARHLDAWRFPVQIIWLTHRQALRGDAEAQWRILQHSGIDQSCWCDSNAEDPCPELLDALIASADWLVDGLLGTGLTRPVEGVLRVAVEAMNRSDKPILALDLPSGLDTDTGRPLGVAVRARLTATFVAPKLGFSAPGAGDYTGEISVIDIGLPRRMLAAYLEPSHKP